MSLNETALACLNRNRLLYLNMLEVLRRGSAELLYAGEGGVLLYDRGSGAYMLTARDRATLDGMLPLLPADCDLLVGHDLWYRDELAAASACGRRSCASRPPGWLRSRRRRRLSAGSCAFWGRSGAPYVCEHYSKSDIGGLEHIRGRAIGRRYAGGLRGRDAGGLRGLPRRGLHRPSGGAARLPPPGLGEALLRGAVRLALERGQYAFGQVLIDNAPSLALQKKVGMTVAREPLYWLFRR